MSARSSPVISSPVTQSPLLGVIADDVTGGTDIASVFAARGLNVVQCNGVDALRSGALAHADVVVAALKIRTAPVGDAVAQALAALQILRAAGTHRFYFKYCSTFDSGPSGNIGPVAEALRVALGAQHVIVCPAYPSNGRQVFNGHLFVDGQLLAESPMRDHPLTPMHDSDVRRILAPQLGGAPIGLCDTRTVRTGPAGIRQALASSAAGGARYTVFDAVDNDDLRSIAAATVDDTLITGAAGLAIGLSDAYRRLGLIGAAGDTMFSDPGPGATLIVAGSTSAATRRQLDALGDDVALITFDPSDIHAHGNAGIIGETINALRDQSVVAVASVKDLVAVGTAQQTLGHQLAAQLVEQTLSAVAVAAHAAGVRRFIVAGGETSGAVTDALQAATLAIGPLISGGVPWTSTIGDDSVAIACKSGNFGSDHFFAEALRVLDGDDLDSDDLDGPDLAGTVHTS